MGAVSDKQRKGQFMKRAEVQALIPTITKDQLDAIMELHGDGLEVIKTNYKDYVSPTEHKKIVDALDELKKAPPPKAELPAEQLAELETLRTYKTNTETAKITESKTAALTKALEAQKANPKAIKLLLKEFALDKVELDDKGEIKGFDELVKPVKENYSDFFGVEVVTGAQAGKAPANQPHNPAEPTDIYSALAYEMNKHKK